MALTEQESIELEDLLNLSFQHEETMTDEQFKRMDELMDKEGNDENPTQDEPKGT